MILTFYFTDSKPTHPTVLNRMDKYIVLHKKHPYKLILRHKMKSKLQSGIQAILFTICCKFPASFSLYWLCKAKCSF